MERPGSERKPGLDVLYFYCSYFGEIVGQVFDGKRRVAAVSGVGAAVDSQVCTGDVRCFRTGHEGDQRGNIVNVAVAAESRICYLGCRPLAGGGIQIRVDRARLNV